MGFACRVLTGRGVVGPPGAFEDMGSVALAQLVHDRIECLILLILPVGCLFEEQGLSGVLEPIGSSQACDAESDESDGLRAYVHALEQLPCALEQFSVGIGWFWQLLLSGNGSEVSEADFDCPDRCGFFHGPESSPDFFRKVDKCLAHDSGVFAIHGEGIFVGDGFFVGRFVLDVSFIDTVCELPYVGSHAFSQDSRHVTPGLRLDIPDAMDSDFGEAFGGAFTYSPYPPDVHGGKKADDLERLGGNDRKSIRLFQVAGEFGQEFVDRHTDRGGETYFRENALFYAPGGGDGIRDPGRSSRHVEEGLVDRYGLNERRRVPEDCHYRARHLAVALPADRQKDSIRAELVGRARRHGGTDAVTPGLVGGGCHDAAPVGRGPHNHGPPPQLRLVELLDSRKECIHVDMEYRWVFCRHGNRVAGGGKVVNRVRAGGDRGRLRRGVAVPCRFLPVIWVASCFGLGGVCLEFGVR